MKLRVPLLAALTFTILALPAMAQRRGGGMGTSNGVGAFPGGRPRGRGRGVPYFADPFLYGYPETSIETPPQFVPSQPSALSGAPIQTNAEPLMIELQAGQYVRRSSGAGQTEVHPADYTATVPPKSRPVPVLVYADGHREEIPDYAIANGMLYIHGTYSGNSSMKHVPLSALDLPATMDANQQRGVKFILPSAPNVVIASF